ncbi:MAG: hypothetical protein U9N39_10425, partial [Campylobacterota bacterium]|nr:hypothetical protein [Campylobacterota bacterium]
EPEIEIETETPSEETIQEPELLIEEELEIEPEASEALEILETTEEVEPQTEIETPQAVEVPETIEEPELLIEEEISLPEYSSDILLAKKSKFEAKIFTKVLDTLGYNYQIANGVEELEEKISKESYKLVILDKESKGLNLESFSEQLKASNLSNGLDSKLLLITESSAPEDANDAIYTDETIKNIVNRDLLRLVIEKLI